MGKADCLIGLQARRDADTKEDDAADTGDDARFAQALFSIKLKGMRNAIISEIRPMVQLVSWPNCGHHSHPKADPGMLSSEKIEPRKIKGMVWLIESLSVITQTLWLILFIMGVKLDSIQSSSFFIRFP